MIWLVRIRHWGSPAKRWLTFLRNHRELIAAMDFFAIPTFTFGVLYCFFVISHEHRPHSALQRDSLSDQ